MSTVEEKTPVIQKSYDYGKFKFLKENRPINQFKVAKLVKSIEEENQSPWRPVLVNRQEGQYRYGVIDGQHQFKALEKLGKPIYFVENPDATIRSIVLLNAFTTNWNMTNYAHYYAKQGKQTYIDCIAFAEKYKVSIALAIATLAGAFSDKRNIRPNFKDGLFEIINMEESIAFMDKALQLRPFMIDTVYTNRNFYTAFLKLLDKVPFAQFLETLKSKRLKIEYRGSRKEYLREFEDILNFEKSKNLIRLY